MANTERKGPHMPGLSDQHQSEGAGGSPGSTRVLVVDDYLDTARVCAKMLQSAGFEVATAPDGFEALRVASEFEPSIMLLDIGLPDIDGFEVARRLRADAKFKAMVLIAFTAYACEESRSRAIAVGFDYYLVKPVPFAELLSMLVDGRPDAALPADRAQSSPKHDGA
jgi:CheY-like chemotaxis protein